MEFFFVGLAMRSQTHDYATVHDALFGMKAQRVSGRIWLCCVAQDRANATFAEIARSLSQGDEMLVVEVPSNLRQPAIVPTAVAA